MWRSAGLLAMAVPCAFAQSAPPAAPSLSANAGVTSNYVSRGFTQSWSRPALQGGADIAFAGGAYAGTWASTISPKEFRRGWLEWDLYAGFSASAGDWGYTLGAAYYAYPGSASPLVGGARYDYAELKLALSRGPCQLQYFRTVTSRWFGTFPDGRGSGYLDLSCNLSLAASWTLQMHVGAAAIAHHPEADWRDVKLGVARDLGEGWSASVSATRAWDRDGFWTAVDASGDSTRTQALGRGALSVSLAKTF